MNVFEMKTPEELVEMYPERRAREYVVEDAERGVEFTFDEAEVFDVVQRAKDGVLVVELESGDTKAFAPGTRWFIREVTP